MKDEFEARKKDTVDQTVENILRSFEEQDLSKEDKLATLSEIFMAVHQEIELGYRLLSEDELKAPPAILWKNRDKSKKLKPLEHIQEQFADRIGRGFVRKHLQDADPELYTALANWLSRRNKKTPNWLIPSEKVLAVSTCPTESINNSAKRQKERMERYKNPRVK